MRLERNLNYFRFNGLFNLSFSLNIYKNFNNNTYIYFGLIQIKKSYIDTTTDQLLLVSKSKYIHYIVYIELIRKEELITLQKFGMCDEINCLEKYFKICHILYIKKPNVAFSVFHFVLLNFFSLMNALVSMAIFEAFLKTINLITHPEFLRSVMSQRHTCVPSHSIL